MMQSLVLLATPVFVHASCVSQSSGPQQPPSAGAAEPYDVVDVADVLAMIGAFGPCP